MKKVFTAMLLIGGLVFVTMCGKSDVDPETTIVGTWSGDGTTTVFNDNGTGDVNGTPFSWEFNDDLLYITIVGTPFIFTNTVAFKGEDNMVVEYADGSSGASYMTRMDN